MDEKDDLLFLIKLYKTWPWCYDTEYIIQLHKRIIVMQHRELVKIKSQKDLKIKMKRKSSKKKDKNRILSRKNQ